MAMAALRWKGRGRFKLHAAALHGTRGVWQPRVVHLVETSYIERGAGPVVVTGSRINDKNSYSPAIFSYAPKEIITFEMRILNEGASRKGFAKLAG